MVKTSVWVNFEMNLLDVANLTRSVETETGRLIRTKLHVNSGMGKQPMAREWSGWLCKVDLLSIRSKVEQAIGHASRADEKLIGQ